VRSGQRLRLGRAGGERLAARAHLLPPWRRLRLHGGPRGDRKPSLSIPHVAVPTRSGGMESLANVVTGTGQPGAGPATLTLRGKRIPPIQLSGPAP
jgi:hypothetical protein